MTRLLCSNHSFGEVGRFERMSPWASPRQSGAALEKRKVSSARRASVSTLACLLAVPSSAWFSIARRKRTYERNSHQQLDTDRVLLGQHRTLGPKIAAMSPTRSKERRSACLVSRGLSAYDTTRVQEGQSHIPAFGHHFYLGDDEGRASPATAAEAGARPAGKQLSSGRAVEDEPAAAPSPGQTDDDD